MKRQKLPRVLISSAALRRRVRVLGREIGRSCRGRTPLLIGILKGSFVFMADLVRALDGPCDCDFLRVSSYGRGISPSGRLRIGPGPFVPLRGRHVVVVEDIADSGRTLRAVLARLRRGRPASLRVCVLLDKPSRRTHPVPIDFTGFRIPDMFVVGYGLDHDGRWRGLPYIGVIGSTSTRP